jgi:ABC-type polar amino acid transport system ATPase subunit
LNIATPNPLLRLELPKRWEFLQEKAAAVHVDPIQVVERVDVAVEHLDELLRRVRSGGGGLIEVVFGLSGSGKTTLLATLPKFY